MIRETTAQNGDTLLLVHGQHGAVSVMVLKPEAGDVMGIMEIHSTRPQRDGHQPSDCDIIGSCYPDISFAAGAIVADYFTRGLEDAAFAAMESWYRSRVSEEAA